MKSKRLLSVIGDISDEYIKEAAPDNNENEIVLEAEDLKEIKAPAKPVWSKWGKLAACVAIVLSVGAGATVIGSVIMQGNSISSTSDMLVEGLKSGEIQKIYHDITVKHYAYSDNENKALSGTYNNKAVEYGFAPDNPTIEDKEELAKLQDTKLAELQGADSIPKQNGIHYEIGYTRTSSEEDNTEKTSVVKFDGDKVLWKSEDFDFYISDISVVSDGVIAIIDPNYGKYLCLAKIDDSGKTAWFTTLTHKAEHERIKCVVENPDGSLALFGSYFTPENKYICFTLLNADGKEVLYKKVDAGILTVQSAKRYGDGYIAWCYNQVFHYDENGNIIDSFVYEAEDLCYYITDTTEFDGNIYISAYSYPKPYVTDTDLYTVHNELSEVYKNIEGGNYVPEEQELTPLIRDNYTAMLLRCNPDKGIPQEIYTIKGSFGGQLKTEDGQLLWDTESISSTLFSPATSSFSFAGYCFVYRYEFNDKGVPIEKVKTGEITVFKR